MKLREIYRSQNLYSVCESDRSKDIVLYIVAGGVMMYEVIIELLQFEAEEFRRTGNLDSLADDFRRNVSKYDGRTIRPRNDSERIEFVDAI
jgi:hypothetical protein